MRGATTCPADEQNSPEHYYRTRSLWLDGLPGPLTRRPPLAGNATCDVAVVGAGFTGLWTAYYLKRQQPDLRVVVIEREIAGFGPSGRNGGWVSGGIAGSWRVYKQRAGPAAVLRAERETFCAVDEVRAVVEREAISCGFTKGGMVSIATNGPQAARLRTDLEVARARGLPTEDLGETPADRVGLRASGCRLALFSPHCARVNPAALVRGLADACERLGVVLCEGTEATAVAPRRVRCRQGTVRADHVVLATESYTTQLCGGRRRYLPLYSLMIATEPLPESTWEELGWPDGLCVRDRAHLFFYAQRTPDGRLAIGGRGAPYRLGHPIDETSERDDGVRRRLVRAARTTFPAVAGAVYTHHWGGPLGVPRDWCMSIDHDYRTGLAWAGGYAGHGLIASNISGRTVADLILGNRTELITLPWVGYRGRDWEPEPLRFLASHAIVRILASADKYEDRTGRPARRTRVLAPFVAPA